MSVFETLRVEVPLEEVAGAKTGEKARCVAPGHEDTSPSMHIYGDHAHCFVCGFHGDVVDVWAGMRGFEGSIEAVLDLAREYDVELSTQDRAARRRSRERREQEDLYLKHAKACYGALSRHPEVVAWWERRGFGPELRERFLLGTNREGTAAVIPYWHRGRVRGLIRRKLAGEPRYLYPKVEEFVGGHRPLFIPGPMRAGAFVVEGPVDALAVAAVGEGVMALGGDKISKEQRLELETLSGSRLYVLFDADEAGKEASRRCAEDLYPKALACPPEYGEGSKDVADSIRSAEMRRARS